MIQKIGLYRAATQLRGKGYEEWNAFVAELDRYATEAALELVRATPEQLMIAQGRAQALAVLARDLANAHIELHKLETKKNERSSPPI